MMTRGGWTVGLAGSMAPRRSRACVGCRVNGVPSLVGAGCRAGQSAPVGRVRRRRRRWSLIALILMSIRQKTRVAKPNDRCGFMALVFGVASFGGGSTRTADLNDGGGFVALGIGVASFSRRSTGIAELNYRRGLVRLGFGLAWLNRDAILSLPGGLLMAMITRHPLRLLVTALLRCSVCLLLAALLRWPA